MHICSLGRKKECNIRILSSLSLRPRSEADLYLGLKPEFSVNLKCWEKLIHLWIDFYYDCVCQNLEKLGWKATWSHNSVQNQMGEGQGPPLGIYAGSRYPSPATPTPANEGP